MQKIINRLWKQIILVLAIALAPCANAQRQHRLKFEHLTPDDGLSDLYVPAIIQDSLGFLWFGTASGLNKYDGYEFTIYRHDPNNSSSLSDSSVNALCEDRDGSLWIGTPYGLNKFDRERERFTRYMHDAARPESISGNRIWRISQDSQGRLWIGTRDDGLNRYVPSSETFIRYQHVATDDSSLSHNTILALYEDRHGTMWIGTGNGLNAFDGERETFTRYYCEPETHQSPNNRISAIHEDRRGNFWIGTDGGGLYRFHRKRHEFMPVWQDDAIAPDLASNYISFISEDRHGMLWIGTLGNGVHLFDPDTEHIESYRADFGDPSALSDNSLLSLYEDRTGIIWIGTSGNGVNCFDPQAKQFTHYRNNPNAPQSLGGQGVWDIHTDRQGVIWLALTTAGLDRFQPDTQTFRHYSIAADQHRASVLRITEDHLGLLWLGTWGQGLYVFDPLKEAILRRYAHKPHQPESISHNIISALIEDHTYALWVGTWGGGLNRLKRGVNIFTRYRHDPQDPTSLADNRILDILEDRSGAIWVSVVGKGVDRFLPETDSFAHYSHDDSPASLSHNTVNVIYEDWDRVLWFGTVDGLNRLDRATNTFTRYTQQQGLADNYIKSIVEDGHGNLWLSTNKGISRFHPYTKSVQNYDVSDGLQGTAFNIRAAAKSFDGTLFFGGNNGLNSFHPDALQDNPFVPPIVLTDVQLFNESVSIGKDSPLRRHINIAQRIVLEHDQAQVGFEFSALNYTAPDHNRYAYMLEGFDADWNHTNSRQRFVRYTNLEPGTYTFRVKGSNNDDVWNEEGVALSVIIRSPWWANRWFRGVVLALLLGLTFGAYSWRMRAIEARRQSLEAQILRGTTELQESQRAMSTLLSNLPGMAYRRQHDPDWTLEFVSEGSINLTGYSPAELLHNTTVNFNALIHPDDRKSLWQTVESNVSHYQTFQATYRIVTRSGQMKWVWEQGQGIFSRQNELLALEGLIIDISEQKKFEDALRNHQEMLELLIDNIPVLLGYIDTQERFLYINNAYAQWYGCSKQDIIGNTMRDVLTEASYQGTRPYVEAVLRGERLSFEHVGNQEGRQRIVQADYIPHFDEHHHVKAFFSMVRDVTQEKQLQEILQQAKDDAESANRAKSAFLANMSHELRTPLHGMLGYTHILKRELVLSERQQRALDIIEQSGQHLLMLIDDILDLAKVESGKVELHETDFHFSHFLQSVTEMIHLRAKEQGLRFELQDDGHLPAYIHSDEQRLRQILLNLLGNAVKFTEHGTVMLKVRQGDKSHSQPEAKEGKGMGNNLHNTHRSLLSLQFQIVDTGIGIPAQKIEEIFEPFQQLGEAHYRAAGSGLGLAISRNLVQLMGGELHVQSLIGQGSTFWFEIPCAAVNTSAECIRQRQRKIIGIQGPPPTILVVDDDRNNRIVLVDLLTFLGFEVFDAADGKEALQVLESRQPDGIIADLLMPRVNGFELVRQVRKHPHFRHVPFIATSASAYEKIHRQSLEAGSDVFLPKPIDIDGLLEHLRRLLRLKWRYQDKQLPIKEKDTLYLPPVNTLETLYELAMLGDIDELQHTLTELAESDSRYTPFVKQFSHLIQGFKLNAMTRLLEGYLHR